MRLATLLKPPSIRRQLLAAYVIGLLLASAAVALLVLVQFVWRVDTLTKKGLTMQADWIEEAIEFDAAGKPARLDPGRNSPWIYASMPNDLKYAVLDNDGIALFSSEHDVRVFVPSGKAPHDLPLVSQLRIGNLPMELLTRASHRHGQTYYVQVARSQRVDNLVRQAVGWPMLKTALGVGAGCLLLFVCVVHLTLKRSLRPVSDASRVAARIEPSNLSARLVTAGLPAELTPLVDAFNNALDRLERGYRVQQEFLAGAAHELKTPLALIRAQIELDTSEKREALLSDVDMMARQVHQLLHLAEVSEVHNYVIEPIDLVAVARRVAAYLGRLADSRQVTMSVSSSVPEGQLFAADRSATFILLKNLVENAIRHASEGGRVNVVVGATGMHVQDDGQGIAVDDLPKLYSRFWRGAERQEDGAGLGLAICHQIVINHGWKIDACNIASGARFSVTFASSSRLVSRQ